MEISNKKISIIIGTFLISLSCAVPYFAKQKIVKVRKENSYHRVFLCNFGAVNLKRNYPCKKHTTGPF